MIRYLSTFYSVLIAMFLLHCDSNSTKPIVSFRVNNLGNGDYNKNMELDKYGGVGWSSLWSANTHITDGGHYCSESSYTCRKQATSEHFAFLGDLRCLHKRPVS